MKRILVDGRVFSSAAFDRGMGRYVGHLLEVLHGGGHEVTVLLYRNCRLHPDDAIVVNYDIRFANYNPEEHISEAVLRDRRTHEFTAYLSALIDAEGYDAYIDATPFLGPPRLDIFSCPVLVVCYDFIPLKHPTFYLSTDSAQQEYYNGLARLAKADHVVCISETVRDEATRYMAVSAERLSVVVPKLEERYLVPSGSVQQPTGHDYLFTILGSHKSKNPAGSFALYDKLLQLGNLDIRVNVATADQLKSLCVHLRVPKAVSLTASISDQEKFAQQSSARVVAHLSIEEGFGIPLLEALFLGKKILALDIPVNREIFNKASAGQNTAVYLLPPYATDIDLGAFRRFLDTTPDNKFYDDIRESFVAHWHAAPAAMTAALAKAEDRYNSWGEGLKAKIFSSIPGSYCGVADYSIAYVRSAPGNVMFFFSEGDQQNISYLPNLRAGTYLDFERFSRSRFGRVKGLFNFAFSRALNPGIELMRTASRPGDVALIHERRYFDGLRSLYYPTGHVERLLLQFGAAESPEDRSRLARDCAFHPVFNKRNQHTQPNAPIASAWLKSLPVRAVSHLSPAVLKQMQLQEDGQPGSIINDLASMESKIEFVPMGIDDRRHPAVARSAERLRRLRGIQCDDIVVGHFGLILDDAKRLWAVTSAILAYAKRLQREDRNERRVFLFLVGKIIDAKLFDRINNAFGEAGLADRLFHTSPVQEYDFDVEIAACDAIVCFRVQTRGQMSHVFVRALSLGTPVLVNERSGFAYEARTAIAENEVETGIAKALDRLLDPTQLTDMRRSARTQYETTHRGDASLRSILENGVV